MCGGTPVGRYIRYSLADIYIYIYIPGSTTRYIYTQVSSEVLQEFSLYGNTLPRAVYRPPPGFSVAAYRVPNPLPEFPLICKSSNLQ